MFEKEDEDVVIFPFDDIEEFESNVKKRRSCNRCKRPDPVCICSMFPEHRFPIETNIHILQHPREQDARLLTTVPLLQECVPENKCIIHRGRRFGSTKHEDLQRICKEKNSVLLFPSHDAILVHDCKLSSPINLFVLDGTWKEAKSIYYQNKFLHSLTKVKLSGDWKSEFVIRTQPNDVSLSTLEAISIAVAQIENKPELIQITRKPLNALCNFQLDYGAQIHQSKEELARLGIKYRCFDAKNKMN